MELDFDRCYRAVDSRDQRFDGWFYTAVRTTGIYCRPSCPALTPKRANVVFYPSAAAAQRGGFRACRRCRPDAAPGSPDSDVRADVVGRAMRLIGDGVVDRDGVPGLAGRLGYTERHLGRMLTAELGAGPLALARAQRAQTARTLIETTDLGLAEIAFAAGFGSVRQFNETIQQVYASSPGALRERRPAQRSGAGTITLRLAFRAPLHTPAMLGFLAARSLPGVEECDDRTYRRGLRLPHGTATVALTPADRWVSATLRLHDVRDLAPAVARCRRLFDLDADPVAVDGTLSGDPALSAAVAAEPGVRVPRAVDGFEMAVRAIVGQQVSVPSAGTTLARLLRAAGVPHASSAAGDLGVFPAAEVVADLPDCAFGMPDARRQTIRALARAVVDGKVDLEPGADREESVARLTEVPGIGAWTAGYVAMRAIGDPDVFLPTDLAARRGAAALGLPDTPRALAEHAERWRPWRSYALVRLWRARLSTGTEKSERPALGTRHSEPARRARRREMLTYATMDTPAGPLTVMADGSGTVRATGFTDDTTLLLSLIHPELRAEARRVDDLGPVTAAIRSYLDGDVTAIDAVPVEQRTGGVFLAQAWQVMRDIKPGDPLTYTAFAELAGRPAAIRGAASACARNAVALFVPCHRVLRTDGSLGGYRWGLDVKRWLLDHERAA